MKYKVRVRYMVEETITVEADSKQDALAKADAAYDENGGDATRRVQGPAGSNKYMVKTDGHPS